MKIKKVCERTNLTERTIRYYVDRGLISPRTEEENGRKYIFFSEEDVEDLLTIAELRKLLFSIDDIIEMLEDYSKIGHIVEEHYRELKDETNQRQEIISALEKINVKEIRSADELVGELKWISTEYKLPESDVERNFGKYDAETEKEKSILAEKAWEDVMGLRDKKRKRRRYTFALIGILMIVLMGSIAYNRHQNKELTTIVWIPSVEFTDKYLDEDNDYMVNFQIVDFGFGFKELDGLILSSKFKPDVAGAVLHNSIITDTEYAMITLEAEMGLKMARELGLLVEDGESQSLDIIKILQDEELSEKYTSIFDIQGDLK